jgi:cell wall-associated NlpC family hydrolase
MKAAVPMPSAPPPLPQKPTAAKPDLRVTAWRPDLAAIELQGKLEAERYVEGQLRQVAWAIAPLRRNPVAAAGLDTELLFGEAVTVFDEAEGWAWVQAARDRYVGYMPAAALQPRLAEPTHWVNALGTFIYPGADIKTPPLLHVSMGSPLAVDERQERFSRLASGGFVVNRHITEVDRPARDFVEIAERFIGTPYLWGGRSRIGLDCSGLLQLALQAAGQWAPRDSDMQEAALGRAIAVADGYEGLERGDLVFWKGHVGIMVDGVIMVHANAHHMAVAAEPLAEAAARIDKTGGPITSIKRLTPAKPVRPR